MCIRDRPLPCPVTYTSYGDPWASPGYLVAWTFAKNTIGTSYGNENRNAAVLAGLRFERVKAGPPGQDNFLGLFGDTLKVRVVVPPPDSLFVASERFGVEWRGMLPDVLSSTVR